MAGENAAFRFLSDEEFFRLSVHERALYLSRASQELETRQRIIREQLDTLKKDVGEA